MYSALGYFDVRPGHWTTNRSAKRYSSLPVNDNVFTLQKLSTKTIRESCKPTMRSSNAATHTGIHVPGPLHITKSGLNFATRTRHDMNDRNVVNTVVNQLWPTSRLLGILWNAVTAIDFSPARPHAMTLSMLVESVSARTKSISLNLLRSKEWRRLVISPVCPPDPSTTSDLQLARGGAGNRRKKMGVHLLQ